MTTMDATLSTLLGISCEDLQEDGEVTVLSTPFEFEDGDQLPIFVERMGSKIRFFDGGGLILHLLGRGVVLDDHRKTRFIKMIAEPNEVVLNDMGELETWINANEAPLGFARFVSALLALVRWEHEQIGLVTDLSLLIDEVALCLRTLKPAAVFREAPEYVGISGASYKADFDFDGNAVLAINPHHSAVSSAAKKILDIRAAPSNADLDVIVIIDDRRDAKNAKSEGLILGSVAKVWMMSRLEREAGIASAPH
jgi:hypothetical protein